MNKPPFLSLIFVALLWTHFSMSVSFLHWEAQNWAWYSPCGLKTGKNTSLHLLRTFLLMQPSMSLAFVAAGAHCRNALACCPWGTPGCFLGSCFLARQKNACTIAWGYSTPATTLCIYLCWTPWHSCTPIFPGGLCPELVGLPSSASTTPNLVLSQLCFSIADAENSDLVAAWRSKGKIESQTCECSRLSVSEQRKELFIIGKKLLLMSLIKNVQTIWMVTKYKRVPGC